MSSARGLAPYDVEPTLPVRARRTPVNLVGTSPAIVGLQHEITRASRSDAKVLILGESGVGKEIVARAVHAGSERRSTQRFAPVNCAGLPDQLLESELFGHERGSFTDAYRNRPGTFESAHMGSVFLDEIGEMSLRMQGLLLRFLETGEMQRVGADHARHVNVRVIGATHRNLRHLVAEGAFREDLFHRLNVLQIAVPPLRDHATDVPMLVDHFLERFVTINRSPITSVSAEALSALSRYPWPGNVRELENLIERLVVTVHKRVIEFDDLPAEFHAPVADRPETRAERRRAVADDLYGVMMATKASFWTAVQSKYLSRDITRRDVQAVVRRGLEEARGNYRIVARSFNLEDREYPRFMNFLRRHQCHLPFQVHRDQWRPAGSADTSR